MPQNNTDITTSPEFKQFVKNANLEVLNLEAIAVILYTQSVLVKDSFERIQELEERLMELAGNVHEGSLVPGIPSLADKWK